MVENLLYNAVEPNPVAVETVALWQTQHLNGQLGAAVWQDAVCEQFGVGLPPSTSPSVTVPYRNLILLPRFKSLMTSF